ncbi:MAG: ribosome maturation factor RimM [Desulfobacterales bacterium]
MVPKSTGHTLVTIGKVSGVHGIRGSLKVVSYAQSLSLFRVAEGITLHSPRDQVRRAAVTGVKHHGRGVLMTLEGVVDRTQAQALVGTLICIERRHLPELEADTYYWADLIGCEVHSPEAIYLGRVDSIIAAGGNDVLVVRDVRNGDRREVLVPMVADMVVGVDLAAGQLTVKLPEGLCAATDPGSGAHPS